MDKLTNKDLLKYIVDEQELKFLAKNIFPEIEDKIKFEDIYSTKNKESKVRKENYDKLTEIIAKYIIHDEINKNEIEKFYNCSNTAECKNTAQNILFIYANYKLVKENKFDKIDLINDIKSIFYN